MPLYLLICKATKRLQFLKKLWKMWEKIEILNLSQQKKKRNYLVSESNYHTVKFFTENLLAIEIKKL